MSSDTILNENSSPTNNLNDLYSTFDARSLSTDSSYSSNKNDPEAQTSLSSSTNPRRDSSIKLPYPVLADHRDPSSVLPLLQKETQTTSKKILDVIQQIESCEKRLSSDLVSEKNAKSLKSERIQRKQQLDALRKHERRVNLQIDYITTKTEIKGLEDDQQQQIIQTNNSDENKQFEILLKKLKQKLDQMKIYMKTRNEQMKKTSHGKQQSSSQKSQQRLSSSDLNRKRPSSSTSTSHSNKHFKSTAHNHNKPPVVRLASRSTNHQRKSHPIQTPIVRFLNKTTDSTINSSSPTTPASSSSTLSPPLIASTSTGDANNIPNSIQKNETPSMLEDGELDVEFDIDELFTDDLYPKQRTRPIQINQDSSNIKS